MDSAALSDMHALVKEHLDPTTIEVEAKTVLVTSNEQTVHDLEEILEKHLDRPKRPRGATTHDTLASLVEHANRHKIAGDSVAFCSLTGHSPCLTVVYNDHSGADQEHAGWRDWRAKYSFPFSDAWLRWTNAAGKSLSVQEFAELLENGIGDIRDPAGIEDPPTLDGVIYARPTELLTLAQGLSVRVDQNVADYRRLENGASVMGFSEKHETSVDGKPVTVPGGFLLGVQVFVGGAAYPVPVRLRYRVKDRQVTWTIVLHDAAGVRRDAIIEAAERFKSETSLPLFFGTPDA